MRKFRLGKSVLLITGLALRRRRGAGREGEQRVARRQGLFIGINKYKHVRPLKGCVNDMRNLRFAVRERELIGTPRAIEPRNFSRPTVEDGTLNADGTLTLTTEIVADHPLTDCSLYANDRKLPWEKPTEQVQGGVYRIVVNPKAITLNREGWNEIRIEYAVRGRYTSRTLRYWKGPAGQVQSAA